MLLGWADGFRRTQTAVEWNYSQQWSSSPLSIQLASEGAGVPCLWEGRKYMARAVGTKRVHLLHLFSALRTLRPQSVLEVGAGNGLNLLAIAACFPDVRVCGIELTQGGVAAAREAASQPALPRELVEFLPMPLKRTSVAGTIDIRQGNARKLELPDRSFDVVFTSLALEQMEEIRHEALGEIARVARRWVVMIEPFRDFNAEGIRRRYIQAHDYFAARIADLREFGMQPAIVSANMPHKLTMKPAFVMASV